MDALPQSITFKVNTPEELKAICAEIYKYKTITINFEPHLFTRIDTNDEDHGVCHNSIYLRNNLRKSYDIYNGYVASCNSESSSIERRTGLSYYSTVPITYGINYYNVSSVTICII